MITRRGFVAQSALAASFAVLAKSHAAFAFDTSSVDPKLLERAKTLLQKAPLIDTHNDLPTVLLETSAGDLSKIDFTQVQAKLSADVPRLREGGVGGQYWSIWVDSGTQRTHNSLHEAIREFDVALRLIRSTPQFEQARTADDIERISQSGKIACLMGVEGGHMIENSPAALRIFYDLGARYMTLTHWDNIDWADAATDRELHYGLTEFGKRVVKEMNRLGMFVDLSHVSADTMRDAISTSRAPVIFSHSNALALDKFPRNVPDDVLAMLPANGGLVHVNFIWQFISPKYIEWQAKQDAATREAHARFDTDEAVKKAVEEWTKANPAPRGTIADVADHIDHIRKVAGIDHIGIGSDFYDSGKNSMVEGMDDVTRYPYLFAELLRRAYSDDDVLKIAGRNHLRAMRKMESVAVELQKSETPLITEGVKSK